MLEKLQLASEPLTTEEKQDIKKNLTARENAPSTRTQSGYEQFFQEQIDSLGNPYDVTRIPISVLKQMQRDPMIAFGLHLINTPVYRASWYIQTQDPQVAAFVDNSLRAILPTYLSQRSQALNFGFKPIVKRFQLEIPNWTYLDPAKSDDELKVWDQGNVEAITWKPFIGLPADPAITEPNWNASGEFAGIKYNGGALPIPFLPSNDPANDRGRNIGLRHSLWVTNERESVNGSLWGFPRVGYAYRYWWSSWFRWALYDRFFERKADPPYKVYYPTGGGGDYTAEDDADPISMREVALSMGEQARSGGVLAFPGDTIRGFDDRPTSVREWDIQELEVKGDMSHFIESFGYLDVMKLRSLFLSELAVTEGSGGTSSRNVAKEQISQSKEASASLNEDVDNEINRFLIPDIVAANFPDYDGEVKKVTTGFTQADQDTSQQVLQWIGQNDAEALRQIDVRELVNRLGLPTLSHAEIRRQEEEAKKALEESAPPVIDPDEVGNAAVTEFGQYTRGREVIHLAEDSDFISRLPKSRHYEDKAVLTATRQIRQRWHNEYKEIYNDFATFISKQNLGELALAEDDTTDSLANRIVNKWKYPRKRIETLLSDTESLVKKIMARAAEREIRRIRLKPDWEPSSEQVAQFLEDRGAQYVSAIDDTTRDELKTFLANQIRQGLSVDQIATAIREHFSDFPGWKADRVARTEVQTAYNFATLTAGERVGIKVVQARDSQLGEERSDPDCIARNGRFFTIGDAMSEVLTEHPNNTLEFILTKRENLSVVHVDQMPEGEESLANFDSENGMIYIQKNIPDSVEQNYLIALGDTLENE
jgi:hypothetical protein